MVMRQKLVNKTITKNENSYCNSCKVYILLMIVAIVISTGVLLVISNFCNDIIDIETFDVNLLNTDKKTYKDIDIFNIRYATKKNLMIV